MSSFTFPKAARGPGHIAGPSAVVSAGNLSKSISIDALMDVADLSDPTLSITIGLEASADGGTTWTTLASVNWDGGRTDKSTGTWAVPYIHNYQADDGSTSLLIGQRVRPFADLPRVVNFGATVTVTN